MMVLVIIVEMNVRYGHSTRAKINPAALMMQANREAGLRRDRDQVVFRVFWLGFMVGSENE